MKNSTESAQVCSAVRNVLCILKLLCVLYKTQCTSIIQNFFKNHRNAADCHWYVNKKDTNISNVIEEMPITHHNQTCVTLW